MSMSENELEIVVRDLARRLEALEKRIRKVENGMPNDEGWKRILQLETALKDVYTQDLLSLDEVNDLDRLEREVDAALRHAAKERNT